MVMAWKKMIKEKIDKMWSIWSLQPEVLRLSFPVLASWVAWSTLLPSCPSHGSCGSGKNTQSHRRDRWETHRVLECTQTHPPGNQHQKGPICWWAVGEVTESRAIAKKPALFPLAPLPHIQRHNAGKRVAPPWRILKAPPLISNR